MEKLSGKMPAESIYRLIDPKTRPAWLELTFLAGLGAAAVIAHAAFRYALRLPGHHDIEWMALLLLGRLSSSRGGAATISSLTAAGLAALPIWGFGDPLSWLIYLVPGPVMDILFLIGKRWQNQAWFLVLLGGFAHATKPALRLLVSASTGNIYGSMIAGFWYPFLLHILFGMLGGLVTAGILAGAKYLQKR